MSNVTREMKVVILWEHELRAAATALSLALKAHGDRTEKKITAEAFADAYMAALNASWAALHHIAKYPDEPVTVMSAPRPARRGR